MQPLSSDLKKKLQNGSTNLLRIQILGTLSYLILSLGFLLSSFYVPGLLKPAALFVRGLGLLCLLLFAAALIQTASKRRIYRGILDCIEWAPQDVSSFYIETVYPLPYVSFLKLQVQLESGTKGTFLFRNDAASRAAAQAVADFLEIHLDRYPGAIKNISQL